MRQNLKRGQEGWRRPEGEARLRAGTLAASSAMGRRGRRRARRHCLAAFLAEHRLLGQEAAAVVISGSAAPRSLRGRAIPRQQSAVMVAATSGFCRAAMHGAAQAFGRAKAIGVAKSVSFKKNRQC